jgi:RNA polymerase primary sigma factor
VEQNLLLVQKVVRKEAAKHRFNHLTQEDLFQEGVLGLMHGIEKFDVERGNQFSTYVTWWITQRIKRAILDQERMIRVPVHRLEVAHKVHSISDQIKYETGETPEWEEIERIYYERYSTAKDNGRTLAKVDLPQHPFSLESSRPDAWYGGDSDNSLKDVIPGEDSRDVEDPVVDDEIHEELTAVLDSLEEKDADMLRMRFGISPYTEVATLEVISKKFGVSRERVRQKVKSLIATIGAFENPLTRSGPTRERIFDPEKLPEYMQEAQLGPRLLAWRAKISPTTVRLLLEEKAEPDEETLRSIAKSLGVTPDDLTKPNPTLEN